MFSVYRILKTGAEHGGLDGRTPQVFILLETSRRETSFVHFMRPMWLFERVSNEFHSEVHGVVLASGIFWSLLKIQISGAHLTPNK